MPDQPVEKTSKEELGDINTLWPLDDEKICFGVRLGHPEKPFRKGEEIFLDYGARANSYLLTEYGFCIKSNQFDYVRIKFKHPSLSANVKPFLKEEIEVDLKKSGFNFELIHYLRLCHRAEEDDFDRDMKMIHEMQLVLIKTRDQIGELLKREVFADTSKHLLLPFAKLYQEE